GPPGQGSSSQAGARMTPGGRPWEVPGGRPCADARNAGRLSMASNKNKLPGAAVVPRGLKARLLAIVFTILLAGCSDKAPQGPAAGAPPPPEVGVVTVTT